MILNNSNNEGQEFLTTNFPFKFQQENKYKDRIEASLLNTKVPNLQLDEKSTFVPFKHATESFSQAVFEFYPLKDFKEHLFNPERFKNPDVVFQDAVVTLLSLAGFSVIIFGKKQ